MRPIRIAAAALTLTFAAAPAFADDRDTVDDFSGGIWGFDPNATSAHLARHGWTFLGISSLSWPDGRQAVVTLWNSDLGDFARCFDFFDADMNQTGGKCERSGTGI